MHKIVVSTIFLIFFGSITANAATFNVFPTASEIVGINLPEANLENENKRFAKEILERFDFDKTLHSKLQAEIFTSLLRFRENSCGGKFESETDFAIKLLHGLFAEDIQNISKNSNLIIRAHQWLMYQPGPDEESYAEIQKVPVSPLTSMFVVDWQIRSYLESTKTKIAIENLADQAWKMNCPP